MLRLLRTVTKVFAAAVLAMSPVLCQAQAAVASWPLWNAYAASFISEQGRVIDPMRGDLTTSEGQAYAMFFALVANDRARFELLLDWTRDNLAGGDMTQRLPGWSWGKSADGEWKLVDQNSASDADLWMAYSLTEAGRLWQEPRYSALGKIMASEIAAQEVTDLPGLGTVLEPGSTGFHPDAQTWILNPSYTPLPLTTRMAQANPAGPWASLSHTLPVLLSRSAREGYAMDWVSFNLHNGFAAAAAPGQTIGSTKLGSYDAIRVYLWAGMTNPQTPGAEEAMLAVPGMATYLAEHQYPPEQVSEQGEAISVSAPVGFSAAVIPYLDTLGKVAVRDKQITRLAAELDPGTRLYGHPAAYYDQNLVMFGKGWLDRRFRFGRDGELKVTWKKR
ncbi:cellulose synthase complex periplasmic endoglucanase BcsZ [Silvibacterium acidisoli]|uniref:cellulose synthase complex periplasmic endoglucanase BcsZ n=1 Tax=Acidobacteriaceae bacterium ZG23-2 TaxID=2883246 RepID=UPI00406CE2F8